MQLCLSGTNLQLTTNMIEKDKMHQNKIEITAHYSQLSS